MTHDEFRRYVTEIHGPLVRSVTAVAADIRATYHYNFLIGGSANFRARPLSPTIWTSSLKPGSTTLRLRRRYGRPGYLEIVRPDEHRFADTARAVMHYTKEWPIAARQTLSTGSFTSDAAPKARPNQFKNCGSTA